MLKKTLIKKLFSYIIIGNLVIYNFSSLVLGATGTIVYAPSTATSGSVAATIGSFDESGVVITNNPGGVPDPYTYTFTDNGFFDFELSGDISTGTVRAEVTRIDKIAPSVTITGNKIGYTNTGFTITVDFSEEVTGFMDTGIVITNGTLSNFQTISGSQYTFDVAPTTGGVVNVDIAANQCTDLVGNGNIVASQFSITYDITSPTISFIDTVETGPVLLDTIIANRGDASTTKYKLVINTGDCDGTGTTAYIGDITFTDETNNNKYFCMYAEDAAGNISILTSDNKLNVDITKPTASAEFNTTGRTNSGVIVTITGFNETITGLNAANLLFTGNGDYTFTFQDIAGNTGTLTGTIRRIDTTPITGYVEYSTTGWTNTGVIATMTGFNKIGVTVSGGTTYTFTENTGYVFYYTDLAGNTGEALATVTGIDMEFPTFSGASTGASYDTGIAITFSDTHISGATVNGSPYNSGDPITNEGTNIFIVTDLAGNSTGATFFIDTTAPIITLSGTSVIMLEVFSGYTEDGAERSDNGLTGVANISGTVITGVVGSYILTYRYSDGFHLSSTGRTINIVDTTAPIITLNGSGTITVERTQSYTELGATRSDNYDITGTVTDITGTVDINTSGTYIITYQKVDSSGNTGTTIRTINVIDTTLPTASIIYSTTGLINQDVLAIITGFSEAIINLNETGFNFTGNGSFTFTFTDIYGNPGSGTATVDWIDKTPVTGTIIYNIIGRTSGDVTAEITGFNKTGVTITSSGSHVFTGNDSYVFTYIDSYGNTGSDTAVVTGIDKTAPLINNTGTTTVTTGGVTFNGIQITEIGIGIDTITLNYSGIVNATGMGSIGLSTGDLANISGAIAGLNDNQTYVYTITAIDLVGNTTTITGGSFTTLFDYQEQYSSIATALQSANISGNLDTVTNANVGSFSGLYFEQTAGKIEFLNAVDLSDTGTIAFLQNLNNYLFMSGGFINFTISSGTTDSGSALQNIQAQLTMYLDPALLPDGALDESLIVVKDNDGNTITPSSSVISNLNCTGTSPQVCTFITNHFTSFGVKPILSGVNIQSNNISGSRALSGNIITLSFTGSENLTGVNVTIFGNSASVVGAGAAWTATYTTNGSEADGPIPFTINFEDLFGNAGDTVTGTTDLSLVTFDKTLPTITINNPNTLPAQSKTITATGSDFNFSGFFMSITGTNTCDGTLTFQTYTSLTFTGESDNGTYVCYQMIDIAGNTIYSGSAMITGIDTTKPSTTIDYNPASGAWTNTDVLATLTGYSETLTGINQITYNFTNSGTFNFTFSDLAGNTGETRATVDWIDKTIPTFTGVISGAYYSGDKSITFSDTNISGATLDGSAYNSGDTISSEGIHIFIVTDLAGNSTGATFIIDKTQPTFAGVTSGVYYNANTSITFDDINLSGATLNGAAYTSGTAITIDNTYIFIVTDRAGNSTGATFILDKTLPIVGTGIISAGNTGVNGSTGYYNGTITIKAIMSDTNISGATCEYSTGSSRATATYTGGGGYCYIAITPNANINVRFRVSDLAGNLNTGGITTYIYDITTPTTTDNANSTTGRVDVPVILSPTDTGVGLSGTRYCVDTLGTCTPTLSGTTVSVTGTAGVITHKYVRYYSVDKLNNTETTKTSVMINIDKETPTITGTTIFSSNNTTNTGYAKVGNTITVIFQSYETLTGTPTMTISGAIYTGIITNIGGNTYSGTYIMRSTDVQGIIGFNIFMTDLVGNTGTIPVTSTLIFDRTNPAGISITSPTNTTYFQGGMTRTITWNTGTEINFGPTSLVLQYSNDGWSTLHSVISTGTANNGSYIRTFPVVDSTMASVRILATDLAGNTANFTGNQFTLDSTQPTDVTITYPSGGEFFKGGSGYTITWSGGTDNFLSGKTIEYSTNGFFPGTTIFTDTMNSFSYVWTTPAINSSGVKLKITVVDRAGLNKVAETSAFYIDSTKPTLTFVDTNSNRRSTNATGTATANDTLAGLRTTGILYRTDTQFDQYCNGGSTTVPVLSADGTGYIYACVMDKAGNVTTGVQIYKIDKTAPTVTMPVDKIVNTGTTIDIIVDGNVAGISGYTRTKLSGTGTVTFTTATIQDPIVSANTDGPYVLQVVVKDNANNVTTGTINFTRHTIAPVLTGATAVLNTTSQTPNYSFTGNEAGTISYSGSCFSTTTIAVSGLNTITFNTLSNATYTGCQLKVTDSAGNASSWLTIPTFTVSYTAPSGGGGGGGGGGGLPICLDTQLMCSNGIYVNKAGVYCQGGNLNKPCGTDICVDGDYSGSPSDGLCKDPTKVEASTGITSTGTGTWTTYTSPFNKELTDAYFYSLNAKITTVSDIKRANMTGVLIRAHLAKMMSEYAIKVLGKTPNTSRKCSFTDMNNQTEEFKRYAIMACQLGLMGLKTDGTPATIFNPDGQVTRAIFGTTLSRTIRGETYNGGSVRYDKHLKALQQSEVMVKIDKPFNRELRGYVMLMMMRADQKITKSSYLTFTSLRGQKIFVPKTSTSTTTTTNSQFTATELDFIKNINKAYQFTEGYTAGQTSAGVKYLQYFLKAKQYYTGTINGINTTTTVSALYQFQFDNGIVDNETDQGAGYLGPTTREKINPLLQKILNP